MSREYRITYGGKEYTLAIERQGGEIQISHDGNRYSVIVDEAHAAPPASAVATVPSAAPPSSGSGNGVAAPMTGVIKSIHVAVGDAVQNGQLVITMEAMKMDIQVNASAAGTVADIKVAAGDSVQQNTPLITLSAAG